MFEYNICNKNKNYKLHYISSTHAQAADNYPKSIKIGTGARPPPGLTAGKVWGRLTVMDRYDFGQRTAHRPHWAVRYRRGHVDLYLILQRGRPEKTPAGEERGRRSTVP